MHRRARAAIDADLPEREWRQEVANAISEWQQQQARRLFISQVVMLVFVVGALALSGVAIYGVESRQQDVDRAVETTSETVETIKEQRILNTRSSCEREQEQNRAIGVFVRRVTRDQRVRGIAADQFPVDLDCQKRVDAVVVP